MLQNTHTLGRYSSSSNSQVGSIWDSYKASSIAVCLLPSTIPTTMAAPDQNVSYVSSLNGQLVKKLAAQQV